MKSWNFLTFLAILCVSVSGAPPRRDNITVAGLFHGDDDISEMAFRHGIERLNSQSMYYQLLPEVHIVPRSDSFKVQEIVCKLAKEGVDVIFGPSSIETSGIVSSIAMKLEIPHIIYHWKTKPLHWEKTVLHNMTLNLYPDSNILAEAFANVLVDYTWTSYTIVYENKENLIRLKDVLQIHEPKSHAITLMQLDDNYEQMLKEIHAIGDSNIVLDVSTEKIIPFLSAASHVNMLTEYNQYFITNLDTATLDLSTIEDLKSNITCLRLMESDKDELTDALQLWLQRGLSSIEHESQVPHEAGLVHDGLQIYFKTLLANGPTNKKKTRLDCFSKDQKSQNGFHNMNFMKTQEYNGVTGLVKFNNIEPHKGSRAQFKLEILELSRGSFLKIGYWDTTDGVKYDRNTVDPEQQVIEAIQHKNFKIVVKLGDPFLMEKKAEEGVYYEGNARYEGYVVDLINKMKTNLKFKYELEVVPDGAYGNYNPVTKKWDGLVKHLLERKADLAVADLTITYERKTAVDFTSPFMTLGIGILFVKAPKKETNQFSFLDSFETDVWIYCGLAYISVSIFTLVLSRINNDDWEASHPCIQEPEEVESIWNFANCVWLSMGSIMGQGCDILPKGSSTRIVTGMWWFFALIMLASYTANLAAFLTNAMMGVTINSADDLAKQQNVKYGAYKSGSTIKFFQESNFSTYQRMWAAMESAGDIVHTTGNKEGVARVNKGNGNYAYLMESVPMEYEMNRECKLRQVGGLLDSKGYGIALPINSPYRKKFSEQILKLSESGVLNELKNTWWKTTLICDDDKPHDDLTIANVGGVFLVLGAGCFVAFIVACCEFLWNVEKIAIEEKISPWDAFKSEVAFAFNFWKVTKPVRCKSSEIISRKSSLPRSLKSRSRYGSESRSYKNKSTRSLNFDEIHDSNSRSLLNLH